MIFKKQRIIFKIRMLLWKKWTNYSDYFEKDGSFYSYNHEIDKLTIELLETIIDDNEAIVDIKGDYCWNNFTVMYFDEKNAVKTFKALNKIYSRVTLSMSGAYKILVDKTSLKMFGGLLC